MTIGIMGEYIGRIYDEVKGRPHYVVQEVSPDEITQTQEIPYELKIHDTEC